MKRAEEMVQEILTRAAQSKPSLPQQQDSSSKKASTTKAILFWEKMVVLYTDKWTSRNGAAPSSLWIQAIGKLSNDQIKAGMAACMRRSLEDGNNFAPDLTDFLALVHSTASPEIGLSLEDVKAEFKRYCRDRGYYDSAELFPWTNSNWLLYWICTAVRLRMVRYNLSEVDVDKALRNEVRDWSVKLAAGGTIPTPATRIENKTRQRPAWMDLLDMKNKQAPNS